MNGNFGQERGCERSIEDIRRLLVFNFKTRLEYWKTFGPEASPYVLPFNFRNTQGPVESHGFVGGLWIPSEETQQIVENAGHYLIHYVLDDDLEEAAFDMGLSLDPPFHHRRLDLSRGDVPIIYESSRMGLYGSTLKEQIESDYGVRLLN